MGGFLWEDKFVFVHFLFRSHTKGTKIVHNNEINGKIDNILIFRVF